MLDTFSYPKLAALIAAATRCLEAIAARNEHALTLTDEERRAIAVCIDDIRFEDVRATLRGLLERTRNG